MTKLKTLFLLSFLSLILLFGIATATSSNRYSDCSVYGNCKSISTSTSSGNTYITNNNTYNNITYINNITNNNQLINGNNYFNQTGGLCQYSIGNIVYNNQSCLDERYLQVTNSLYYLQNVSSDLTGYKVMQLTPNATQLTLTYSISSTSNFQNFSTPLNFPNTLNIPQGAFAFHIHASATTAGVKNVQLYGEIDEINSTGSLLNVIGNTETSTILTNSQNEYNLIFASSNVTNLNSTNSRITLKIYAVLTGSGTNPTISLYLGDGADSHLQLPLNSQGSGSSADFTNVCFLNNTGQNFVGIQNFTHIKATSVNATNMNATNIVTTDLKARTIETTYDVSVGHSLLVQDVGNTAHGHINLGDGNIDKNSGQNFDFDSGIQATTFKLSGYSATYFDASGIGQEYTGVELGQSVIDFYDGGNTPCDASTPAGWIPVRINAYAIYLVPYYTRCSGGAAAIMTGLDSKSVASKVMNHLTSKSK